VLSRDEIKKLERKAKNLMLVKEIPQGKVDVIRSIMANNLLLEEERYSTIIELLKHCTDKPQAELKSPKRVALPSAKPFQKSAQEQAAFVIPATDSAFVSDILIKYKSLGIYKKRYLAPSSNRFGISFMKRLIPTKKLLQLMLEIRSFQERVSSRLPVVMDMILEDQTIEDPTTFNYFKVVQVWLMETPLAGYTLEQVKWMTRQHFEAEIKNWCIRFYSFSEMDTGAKESIILAFDAKLREMPDLKKDPVLPEDPDWIRSSKEKQNLEKEKMIYDTIMTLRSFIPSIDPSDGILSKYLNTHYGITSVRELAKILLEALVFAREISHAEIIRYYTVTVPKVSSKEWDSSPELLRRAGKDPESKKRRYIEKLRSMLVEYDELYGFIAMRYESVDFVRKAFDEQWRLINKRRQDATGTYERDFFTFIDECLSYFLTIYVPFINGSNILLVSPDNGRFEKPVFSASFFETEISTLVNVQGDLFQLKSSYPNYLITHAEAKRIAAGQIPSMHEIDIFLKHLGATFYALGKSLQKVLSLHKTALQAVVVDGIPENREPLGKDILMSASSPRVIPFYDSKILASEKHNAVQKLLVGHRIVGESAKDGILNSITAFCYQFSQECFDRSIANELDFRKDLIRKIEEAERS
jgi:hypothetical protein